MQLVIKKKCYQFKDEKKDILSIIKKIEEEVQMTDDVFSHLIVDGVAVYDDFETYLSDRIGKIGSVEAVFQPVKQHVLESLYSLEEYLNRALPEMKALINEFYTGPAEESWAKFNQWLEGIEWIQALVTSVDRLTYRPSNWDQYVLAVADIQNTLPELENALQSGDIILLADILQYEIYPIMESLKTAASETIDQEGKRPNVN